MTDRELLELAAQAAGVSAYWSTDGTIVVSASGAMATMPYEDEWNPLKNDGDALRLAAVLRLHILHNDPGEPVLWVSAVLNKRGIHGVVEFQDEEQLDAATRRAIVLAAAEIGRRQADKATKGDWHAVGFLVENEDDNLADICEARYSMRQKRIGVRLNKRRKHE